MHWICSPTMNGVCLRAPPEPARRCWRWSTRGARVKRDAALFLSASTDCSETGWLAKRRPISIFAADGRELLQASS